MTTTNRFLIAALALLIPLGNLRGQDRSRSLDQEGLAPLQEAARQLAREIEYLQEDMAGESNDQKERTLYRQADAVLADLERFQRSLKPGADREQLAAVFDPLDVKVHELLKAVRNLGPKQRALQRAAARVDAADEQLHYALFGLEPAKGKAPQLIERQTGALVARAQQLEQTAEYALGAVQGRGVLLDALHKFTDASKHFQDGLGAGADHKQLQRDYAAVNQAWERVVGGMKVLKPGEQSHLVHLAEEVDRVHDRLFRLLGMEGDRSRLIIRT